MAKSLTATTPSVGYTPAAGGVPTVPSPLETQAEVVKGQMPSMPDIKALGRSVSKFPWTEYTGRVPGYTDMASQSAVNIAAALRGEVPQDVLYQLGQSAAERGITQGVPGSQITGAEYLKALGLTSLGQQKYGEEALTGALKRAESVPVFDISRFLVSPQEQQQWQYLANQLSAAPIPAAATAEEQRRLEAGMQAGQRAGAGATGGISYPQMYAGGGSIGAPATSYAAPSWGPVVGARSTAPATSSSWVGYSPWTESPSGTYSWTGGTAIPGGGYAGSTEGYVPVQQNVMDYDTALANLWGDEYDQSLIADYGGYDPTAQSYYPPY